MKIIEQGFEILTPITGTELREIEFVGRTCYKSEDKITIDSEKKFVRNLIKNGHEAMLEHMSLTVRFICDRGISHELVRHRLASFAQESTRYCNYSSEKFGGEVTFIKPVGIEKKTKTYFIWDNAMSFAENNYFRMIGSGVSPQIARSVLPNSLKTEVVMTANYREWRHFFKLRALGTTGKPHPAMQKLASDLLKEVKKQIPVVFDDLVLENDEWQKSWPEGLNAIDADSRSRFISGTL